MAESTAPAATRHAVLREMLVALFATPAALSVLAKLDSRLDFASLLERIILNFDHVARAVWNAVSGWIGIDLTRYHQFLTFSVLLIAPILTTRVRSWLEHPIAGEAEPKEGKPGCILPIVAVCFLLWLIKLFEVGDSLLFLAPVLMLLVVPAFAPDYWRERHDKTSLTNGIRLAQGIGLLGLGLFSLWVGIRDLIDWEVPLDVKLVFILFSIFGVVLIYYAFSEAMKTLAYAALWVSGIVILNWIATVAIPGVDAFLKGAGA